MLADLYYRRQQRDSQELDFSSRDEPSSVEQAPLREQQQQQFHCGYEEPSRSYVTSGEIFDMRSQQESTVRTSASNTPHQHPARPSVRSPAPQYAPPLPEQVPIVARDIPRNETLDLEPVDSVKVLRFSSKNAHATANSIRTALLETLNENTASGLTPVTDEYLMQKRRLFLETLFTDDTGCLLPPRFDIAESPDLCALQGPSSHQELRNLANLWDRLQ